MSSTEVAPSRLDPIMSLVHESCTPERLETLRKRELAAEILHKEHDALPTIGCEVEISWASLYPELIAKYFSDLDPAKTFTTLNQMADALPDEKKKKFLEEKAAIGTQDQPKYAETVAMGIPRGNDGYWEFAHSPAYAWQTVSEEINILMEQGLIPVGYPNAMHITLGGIAIEGGGPHMILAGLELLSVPSERIRRASESSAPYSWARRASHNIGGVRHRPAHKLGLDQSCGVEFRTLSTSCPKGHRESLRAAQLLGAILQCRRNQDTLDHSTLADIASLWQPYKTAITSLFDRRGLPNGTWDAPHANKALWQTWADCLDKRDNPNTPEHTAVQRLTEIIDKTEELLNSILG